MLGDCVPQAGCPCRLCWCTPVMPASGAEEGDLQSQAQCGLLTETLSQNRTNLGHPFIKFTIVLNLDTILELCTHPLVFKKCFPPFEFFWFYSNRLGNFLTLVIFFFFNLWCIYKI